MKNSKIEINIDELKKIQLEESRILHSALAQVQQDGERNKEKLLKYVIPFAEAIFELHNHKCKLTQDSPTGCEGLLGLKKVNVKNLLEGLKTSSFEWHYNFRHFQMMIVGQNMSIWLKDKKDLTGKKNELEYSISSFNHDTLGTSISEELKAIAKYCAKYTDEWPYMHG